LKPLRPSEDPSPTGSDNLQSTPTKGRFIWLEEHFTTRHAGKAQPYMCLIEGCTLRFTLKRALEEHLRTGHEKAKAAESDFMDRSVDEWIVMRLRQYERTNNPSFVVREPATPRISGAAHRKRRRILTFAIESDHIAPEIVSESMDLADTKAHCTGVFIGSEECRISNGTAGPIVK
uniref:C2H2-type domain-containing protein n=1 Tax=Gongylonema pulchrum TaxID=637853 RepID=A0A183EHK6_9BILA